MNRIKDLNKIKTRPDMLYCEVVEKKLASGLFLPDDGKTGWDYLKDLYKTFRKFVYKYSTIIIRTYVPTTYLFFIFQILFE